MLVFKKNDSNQHSVEAPAYSAAKGAAKYGAIGSIVHGILCPFDGAVGILIKAGVISSTVAGPLYIAHERVVDNLTHALYPEFISDMAQAHQVSHSAVDYAGWAAALGMPLYAIGKVIYKKRKSKKDYPEHKH